MQLPRLGTWLVSRVRSAQDGCTALHYAALPVRVVCIPTQEVSYDLSALRWLLTHGAATDVRDKVAFACQLPLLRPRRACLADAGRRLRRTGRRRCAAPRGEASLRA